VPAARDIEASAAHYTQRCAVPILGGPENPGGVAKHFSAGVAIDLAYEDYGAALSPLVDVSENG
jgi:hypothetical protein